MKAGHAWWPWSTPTLSNEPLTILRSFSFPTGDSFINVPPPPPQPPNAIKGDMCYNGIGSVLKKILLKGDRKSWKSHLTILKIKLLPDLWYLASLGYDIAIINLARAIWLKKKAFFDLVIMTFPKHKLIDPIKFPWTGANKYSRNGGSYFKWFR